MKIIWLNDISCYDVVMSCPYDSWGYIVDDSDHISGLTHRWCIYDAYMATFIRIRRSTNLENTSSLLDDVSLVCCCCHMRKDHILQL